MRLVYAAHVPPLQAYKSVEFDVFDIRIDNDAAYAIGMSACYENDRPFVNIEHDMQVDDDHIRELFDCPFPYCTWAYKVFKPHMVDMSTGQVSEGQPVEKPHNAQCDWLYVNDERHAFLPIEDDIKMCVHTGIGFCKISPHGEFPIVHWTGVEIEVNKTAQACNQRSPWHVHWPAVQHWHR